MSKLHVVKWPVEHRMMMFWLDNANNLVDKVFDELDAQVGCELDREYFECKVMQNLAGQEFLSLQLDGHLDIIASAELNCNYAATLHDLLDRLFDAKNIKYVIDEYDGGCFTHDLLRDALRMFSSLEELEVKMWLSGDEKYTYEGHNPEKWAQLCRETKEKLSSKKSV